MFSSTNKIANNSQYENELYILVQKLHAEI